MLKSILILQYVLNANALNILVYSPSFGASHTNFMARLADTLTDAGHNVTFLVPISDETKRNQLGVKKTKDVVVVEQDEEMRRLNKPLDDDMAVYWSTEIDSSNVDIVFNPFAKTMQLACANMLRNEKIFDEMKSRNFDVGIYEPLFVCGLALMHALGLHKTMAATSCALYDGTVAAIGEPIDASYVPGVMSKARDQMTIFEKVENYRMIESTYKMERANWDEETKIYKKYLGDEIPDWKDLMPTSSVFFTNSIPYLDFPRLVTQKTVPIGGISVDIQSIKSQKLSIEWSTLLDERPFNMLISFGSLARSVDMPEAWKKSLLEAIKSEPNVTFIWKYETDDLEWARGVKNVHFSKWTPQTALLADYRLTTFMTHGGLGSTNEIAYLGKPALMIPLFCDQNRNANMLAKHGGVTIIQKRELENSQTIRKAIRSILHDETYKKNAEKFANLLLNQPHRPEDQVVKYTEFVAKFGPFPEMDPQGRKLGFIGKNLLDVYFIIALSYLIPFSLLCIVLRFIFKHFSLKIVKND